MIRILTDSGSGFTLQDAKEHNFEMLHLAINFEDAEYLDGLNITTEEFYKKLKASKKLPKTSAVNQTSFEEVFNDVKKKNDEMIVLCISSGLSVTTDQAIKAKEAVGYKKIYVVNTLAVSASLVALVMEAVRMRNEKVPAEKIAAEIEKLVPKVKLYAYVDTLRYLCAGGRISTSKAIIGTVLGIKPSLTVEDGTLHSRTKFVGVKKAQAYVLSQLKNDKVDFSKPVYFAHTNAADECEKVRQQAKQAYSFIDGGMFNVSATVGTHTGPGANAIVFFEK